jgi:predicted nucleotidyltransferase
VIAPCPQRRPSRALRVGIAYGSVARSAERSASDVDLMVIGEVGLAEIASAIRKAEARLGRLVNSTVYTPLEFTKKLKAGHHFLQSVLRE